MDNFTHIKQIQVKKNSIFYSIIHYKDELLGFGRDCYNTNTIRIVKFDNNFEIIDNNLGMISGEDPRCFIHCDKLYILNNCFSSMTLFQYDTKQLIRLPIPGKNISFISHDNNLYFIHYIKPFILYKIDLESGDISNVEVITNDIIQGNIITDEQLIYRGGTPGYKINNEEYYGYGHKTYTKQNDTLIHDIFRWDLSFSGEKPTIKITDQIQPINSKCICDPTSVIEINNKTYLLTAESDLPWFCDQDYITNVYQIN